MTLDPLAGLVVVLAGPTADADPDTRSLAVAAAAALLGSGVLLAAVTTDGQVIDELSRRAETYGGEAPVSWRADPADPATWRRLYPHIEQRLGPVDAVLTDPIARELVETVFRSDMHRRGHGAIVALSGPADPVAAIREQLNRTP